MDATLVNWETLDSLVTEFAKSENLFEDDSSTTSYSSPSVSSSSYRSRLIIRHITRSLEAGQIDAAIHLLQSHAPFILDDHTLLFRLQKQKFIELLRKGSEEDRNSAIDCARTALAPCALHAYPEAYEEFKHVLLAFIYNKDDQTSPVANEWSEQRRLDIAGLMSSVLRAHLHAYDPIFSMTLRYLISIHKAFCFRQGISSPVSDLYERLLLEERDPPVVPQESFYEAPPFDEVDIQALAHAVEITRQGAVDSLKFAKGDLFQAFQNELCRMRLDVSVLHDLVREYCVYRGIVDSDPVSPSALQIFSRLPRVDQQETISSSGKSSLEIDPGVSKCADVETSISNTQMDGSSVNNIAVNITQAVDVEFRYSGDSASNCEDCSTSGSHQRGNLKVIRKSRKYESGERSKRKRWRGRQDEQDEEDYMTGVSFNRCSRQDFSSSTTNTTLTSGPLGSDRHFPIDTSQKEDKYEFMLGMKELASKGMAADVVNEVNAFDSNFFVENPVLLFQLKQVEFLNLVNSGDHSRALKVASSHLGPIAARDPALLKPLKETLLALLRPNEEAFGKCLSLHTLANSIQVAIGKRLGIEEPQLMKIMRATLHTHNEWFKLQMCKDRFESLLRIDSLKDVDTPLLSARSMSKSNADSCTQGSSQVTVSSGARVSEDSGSPTQASSGDIPCDENAILKVMEFLALPRADAIHLLAQYNGNAETVIQHIFA